MSDDRVRRLERSWQETKDPQDEERLLAALLGAGQQREAIERAAHLGHGPALSAAGLEPVGGNRQAAIGLMLILSTYLGAPYAHIEHKVISRYRRTAARTRYRLRVMLLRYVYRARVRAGVSLRNPTKRLAMSAIRGRGRGAGIALSRVLTVPGVSRRLAVCRGNHPIAEGQAERDG